MKSLEKSLIEFNELQWIAIQIIADDNAKNKMLK